jgi:serine/threonine-protein kinase RsbW
MADLHPAAADARPRSVGFVVQSMAVTGEPGELRELQAFLAAFWEVHDLPPGDAMRVALGLEEVFINIVTHGLDAGRTSADVTVDLCLDGTRFEMIVEDPGPPFDPLATGPGVPEADASLEARPLGGLGVHLVRALLDDIRYERRGERNRLVMTADLARDPA